MSEPKQCVRRFTFNMFVLVYMTIYIHIQNFFKKSELRSLKCIDFNINNSYYYIMPLTYQTPMAGDLLLFRMKKHEF